MKYSTLFARRGLSSRGSVQPLLLWQLAGLYLSHLKWDIETHWGHFDGAVVLVNPTVPVLVEIDWC